MSVLVLPVQGLIAVALSVNTARLCLEFRVFFPEEGMTGASDKT